jgi:hypothetical protein
MGLSIGWPNASASSLPLRTGWFRIISDCAGFQYPSDTWTTLQTDVNWQTGQFVYIVSPNVQILLGNFTDIDPGETQLAVQGPASNSCIL